MGRLTSKEAYMKKNNAWFANDGAMHTLRLMSVTDHRNCLHAFWSIGVFVTAKTFTRKVKGAFNTRVTDVYILITATPR